MSTPISVKERKFRKKFFTETDGTVWNDASISGGDETKLELIRGYEKKTVYFLSDTAGTLTIQIVDPDGARKTYDTVSISANTLEPYPISPGVAVEKVALKFDTAATVSAWLEKQA